MARWLVLPSTYSRLIFCVALFFIALSSLADAAVLLILSGEMEWPALMGSNFLIFYAGLKLLTYYGMTSANFIIASQVINVLVARILPSNCLELLSKNSGRIEAVATEKSNIYASQFLFSIFNGCAQLTSILVLSVIAVRQESLSSELFTYAIVIAALFVLLIIMSIFRRSAQQSINDINLCQARII